MNLVTCDASPTTNHDHDHYLPLPSVTYVCFSLLFLSTKYIPLYLDMFSFVFTPPSTSRVIKKTTRQRRNDDETTRQCRRRRQPAPPTTATSHCSRGGYGVGIVHRRTGEDDREGERGERVHDGDPGMFFLRFFLVLLLTTGFLIL